MNVKGLKGYGYKATTNTDAIHFQQVVVLRNF